jgi:hypothetical protein
VVVDEHTRGPIDLEASWTEALPPNPIRLVHRSTSFSWERHCLYASTSTASCDTRGTWSSACPRATLVSTGQPCVLVEPRSTSASVSDCHYQCTGAAGDATFQLPAKVRFERVTCAPARDEAESPYVEQVLEKWEDDVAFSFQRLASFVPPGDRGIELRFDSVDQWQPLGGDELYGIEVRGPSGATHVARLPGANRDRPVFVPAPGVRCGDRVTVHVLGARQYRLASPEIVDGTVTLMAPPEYEVLTRLGFSVGSGARVLTDAEFRRGLYAAFGLYLSFHGSAIPLLRSLAMRQLFVELETDVHLFQNNLSPVSADQSKDLDRWAWHRRHLFAISWLWAHDFWRLGVTAGGGFTTPLDPQDRWKFGDWDGITTLGLVLRWRIRGRANSWFEGAFRTIFDTAHYSYRTDGSSDPVNSRAAFPRAFLELRMRFGQ